MGTWSNKEGKYDVDILISLSEGRKPVLISIPSAKLDRTSESGFTEKRYRETDTSFPILMDHKGRLADGRHRCCKLLDQGIRTVWAIMLTECDLEAALLKRAKKHGRFAFALHNLVAHPVMEVLHWFGRDDLGDKIHAWTIPARWEK
jgi:hypothetical protein